MAHIGIDIADYLYEVTTERLQRELANRADSPAMHRAISSQIEEAEQARYELDTLIHDLRAAFLARDGVHFDVLVVRLNARLPTLAMAITRRKVGMSAA